MAANNALRSRRQPVVRNPLAPVVESVFATPQGKLYPVFNGTTHYATIPAWAPVSAQWDIYTQLNWAGAIGSATLTHILTDPSAANRRLVKLGSDVLQFEYLDTTATSRFLGLPAAPIGLGEDYLAHVRASASGASISINGVTNSNVFAPARTAAAYTHVAAGAAGALLHNGAIKHLSLIDRTPLQGARFLPGNGTNRYIAITEITLAGDFEIEFWCNPTSGITRVVGNGVDTNNRIYVDGTNGTVVIVNAAGASLSTPAAVVTSGQHHDIKITRVGGTVTIYVDGVSSATSGTFGTASFDFDSLYRQNSLYSVAGSHLANLIIRDLTNGNTWEYSNRNDSGNVVLNSNGGTAEGAETAIPADTSNWSGTSGSRTLTNITNAVQVTADSTSAYTVAHTLTGLTVGEHLRIRMNIERGTNTGTLSVRIAPDPLFGAPVVTDDYTSPNSPGEVEYIVRATGTTMYIGVRSSGHAVGESLFIYAASTQNVTHGIAYEGSTPMTDAAADSARSFLPMISREYIFDEAGRIQEVRGGGADATLQGGLSATDWKPE